MRRTELDSLRGLAAFAVLLWHATASSLPAFNAATINGDVGGLWQNLLMYSPLRIVTAGPEAVWVFFILSGFVLTRSAGRAGYNWDAYYPSRIARLYLPVIAAVLFTLLLIVAVPRVASPENAGIVAGLPSSYPFSWMVLDATLLTGTSPVNVPLWSLQWEVLFSLLLPLYVLLARRAPRVSVILAVVSVVGSVWAGSSFLLYMPMFLIGAVLGRQWEAIAPRFAFLDARNIRSTAIGVLALGAAVALITLSYTTHMVMISERSPAALLAQTGLTLAKLVGIVMLVTLAMSWHPLRRLLRLKPLVALGTVSFSLYLVHAPILITLAFVMGAGPLTTVIQVLVCLAVAIAFYFFVERRAHQLSRGIAKRLRAPSEPSAMDLGAKPRADASPE